MDTKNKLMIIGIASALVLSIWNTRLHNKVDVLQNEVINYQNQLMNVQSHLENEISSFSIDLQKKASILSNSSYEFKGLNKTKETTTIFLQVTPKKYTDGMKVSFVYKMDDGKEGIVEADKGIGQTFTATIEIPLVKSMEYSVILDDGKTKQSEDLESISGIKDQYLLDYQAYTTRVEYRQQKNTVIYTGGAELQVGRKEKGNNELESAVYEIVRNGEKTLSKTMEKQSSSPVDMYQETLTYKLNNFKLELRPDDVIEFIVKGKDTNGFTYTQIIDKWKIDNDGEVINEPLSEEGPKVTME